MTRLFKLALVLVCTFSMVGSASAVKWLTDQSYRVSTMGGATLGIEDETTATTIFNHENLAGMVLNPQMNRIDGGLVYGTETDVRKSGGVEQKTVSSDMELTRPGAQYRGLTYWLDKSTAIRVGIEGMLLNRTDSVTGGSDEKLDFSGLGGGASMAYKTDFGLAIGAGASYTGAGGKPNSLTGTYNVLNRPDVLSQFTALDPTTTVETKKLEIAASNLDWGIGLAYVLEGLGQGNKLGLGFSLGTDDDRPSLTSGLNLSNPDFGDYNAVITTEGEANMHMASQIVNITNKQTITNTPMKIAGEAIFNMGTMLEAGLLFDSKTKETKVKSESIAGTTSTTSDFKTAASSMMAISPIVRANIPLGGVNLLPGVMFTTYGTGTNDLFAPTSDTASSKYQSTKNTNSAFSIGCGIQALEKALQAAVQYTSVGYKSELTQYDPASGTTLGTATAPDASSSILGLGAEYWIIPAVAVRAGYTMSSYVSKPTSGEQKMNVNTISFGAGYASPNGMATDLLVKMVTMTNDPKPTGYDETHTAFGIFLGDRIPF